MNNDWFDRQLNEQYNKHQAPMDVDQAWAGFQQRRKKKRRPMGWWWLTGLLLAGMVLGVWWANYEGDASKNKNSKEDTTREVTRPLADAENRNLIADETNNKKTMTEQSEIQSPGSDLSNTNLVVAPSTSKRNSALINGDVEPILSDKPKDKNEISFTTNNDLIEEERADLLPPFVEDIHTTIQEKKEDPIVGINEKSATKENADPGVISEQDEPIVIAENNIIEVKEKVEQDSIEIMANEDLPSEEAVALQPKTKISKWHTGVMLAYGFTHVSLKEKDAPHATLEPVDKPQDFMVAGWDIRYYIRPAFFIQSGLNVHHYTDKRSVDYTGQRMWTDSNALVEQIIRADGTITDVYGNVSVIETRRTTGVRYHTLTAINLPVMFGTSLPFSQGWLLDIYGGVQGSIFQLSKNRSNIEDCDACLSTTTLYWEWGTLEALLRIEPTYTFSSSGWLVGGGFYGVVGLNNRMTTNSGLVEKRHSLGMSVVVRKQF